MTQPRRPGITTTTVGAVIGAILVAGAVLAVVANRGASTPFHSASAPFHGACVTDPGSIATGAGGSLYVQDAHGISHYSPDGRLLARIASKRASFAVDPAGNLYVSSRDQIVKVSGRGSVLARVRAPGYQPVAVDRRGTIVAVLGGSLAAVDTTAMVERLSPAGRVLNRWQSAYASTLVFGPGGSLYGNGGLSAGGDLVRLDPLTGRVLMEFHRALGNSFDALAADARGNLYVAITTSGSAPFAVQRISIAGGVYRFHTLNTAQESVTELAVSAGGPIFVTRASYAEPGAGGGTGLEELSASGSSLGKFDFC